jgi:hypothetical protein
MAFTLHGADVGRRKFTAEEDDRLRNLVLQFGARDWVTISYHMPGRNARQCRHRYNNYLVDDHQYFPWREQEEEMLIAQYQALGPKWVEIATHLPGRTGNDVKNRWHKHILKKRPLAETLRLKVPTGEATASPVEHPLSDAPSFLDDLPPGGPPKPRTSSYLQFVLN